jgi:hypothetical protein
MYTYIRERDGIKKKKKEKTKNSRGSLHFNILGPTPPLSFFFPAEKIKEEKKNRYKTDSME